MDEVKIGTDAFEMHDLRPAMRKGPATTFDVGHVFKYHAPTPEQVVKYGEIREAAKTLASTILANTPPSADQSAALRLLREAVMTANAAIALGGRLGLVPRQLPPPDPAERGRVAALAARLFAASIDHAPHAHAFSYSAEVVLEATCSARRYAVAQARALLQEVDAQLTEDAPR